MPGDPFKQFKYIPLATELLETAIQRANKRSVRPRKTDDAAKASRKKEIMKIDVAFDYISTYLKAIVSSVPDLGKLRPFYVELSQIIVNNDELKRHLGKISGSIRVIENIRKEQVKKIIGLGDVKAIKTARKEAFGRLKSVLDKIASDLEFLREARAKLKSLPVVHENLPAVVFAGYPNVGKSSCINNLCGSRIKVAHYPFTTKEIKIGLLKTDFTKIQLIDTPGVLDRPMASRNKIERQAILAMERVANLLVFVLDPTFSCGYSLDDQVNLLSEVQDAFPRLPGVVLINKMDIATPERLEMAREKLAGRTGWKTVHYSAVTRENEEIVLDTIKGMLKTFKPGMAIPGGGN